MSDPSHRLAQVSGQLRSGLLRDQVAVITGGAQGIGRATALLFAKEGARVVLADLDGPKAQLVVDEINGNGGHAIAIDGDVTAESFPQQLIATAIEAFGDIHHIVNNAGWPAMSWAHLTSDESFDLMLKVHVTAPFRIVREAAPHFRIKEQAKRGNRSIVNVSSIAGLHGIPGTIGYGAAKSAVLGMTKTIAKEFGPFGTRCNTVAFGGMSTRLIAPPAGDNSITIAGGKRIMLGVPRSMEPEEFRNIPLGRPGTTEEAAQAILFLCSPLASYITGHTLQVTGGQGI